MVTRQSHERMQKMEFLWEVDRKLIRWLLNLNANKLKDDRRQETIVASHKI